MNLSRLEALFIARLEKNASFMKVVGEYPEDIYERRNDPGFADQWPGYAKYAGYKSMVKFHAGKLVHLPPPPPPSGNKFIAAASNTALDIGGGPGYLAMMLRELGYKPVIMDVPEEPGANVMERLRAALGLKTVFNPVEPFKPLPELPEKPFALITATNLVFDVDWNWDEYEFFLRDLARNMIPTGSIYLYFNPPQGERIWGQPGFLNNFLHLGFKCIVDRRALLLNGVGLLRSFPPYASRQPEEICSCDTNCPQ